MLNILSNSIQYRPSIAEEDQGQVYIFRKYQWRDNGLSIKLVIRESHRWVNSEWECCSGYSCSGFLGWLRKGLGTAQICLKICLMGHVNVLWKFTLTLKLKYAYWKSCWGNRFCPWVFSLWDWQLPYFIIIFFLSRNINSGRVVNQSATYIPG